MTGRGALIIPLGDLEMHRNSLKKIERVCLKCNHIFTARGRYNRLCKRCKNHQIPGCLEEHKVIFPWS